MSHQLRSQAWRLLTVAAPLALASAAPWIAQTTDRLVYPPGRAPAGPSLRVVGPEPHDHPAADTLAPYIEYGLYALSAALLTALFLRYLRTRRIQTARAATTDRPFAPSSPSLADGTTSTLATTAQIRRTDAEILTLTGRHQAHGRSESPVAVDETTRTRAIEIAKTAAVAPGSSCSAPPIAAKIHETRLIQGRYELREPLASGGAGVVYQAFDTQLQRPVAMKNLFQELATRSSHARRFIEEAHALAALSHPNIVPIYDLIADDDYWLVMEYLPGGSLADLLNREGFLEHDRAIPILRDVARALAAAHRKGFIHRDVKPGNVLFDEEGQVKVADFGIAKSARSTVETTAGVTLGSPAYLSPEQCEGSPVTSKSDIYSLGVTAYETLTGERPFEGDQQEVLAKHLTRSPEPLRTLNPELPQDLDKLILTMLTKAPAQRPSPMEIITFLHGNMHYKGTQSL